MPRKKTKQKNSKKSTGMVKISNLAPKSFLSNALSNYKKNKELNITRQKYGLAAQQAAAGV